MGRKGYSTDPKAKNLGKYAIKGALTGQNHPNWKNGYINKHGYRVVKVNGKSRYLHRFLIQDILGINLKKNEWVRHLNGNKQDNSIENLKIIVVKDHQHG